MADPKLYLRPIGFLYGETAAEAVAEGAAFALAGGPISFTAAELIEGTPSSTERRLLAAKELAGSRDSDLGRVLEARDRAAPALRGARSLSSPDHGHRQRHAGLILGRRPLRQDGRRDRPCRRACSSRRRYRRCGGRVDPPGLRPGGGGRRARPRAPGARRACRAASRNLHRYAKGDPWRGLRHAPAPRSSTTSRR